MSTLTSYRVTWQQQGNEKSQTGIRVVDSDEMTRPCDPEQLRALLRKMIANRFQPISNIAPDSIVLLDVVPVCNCEPYPGANCLWDAYKGERFYLVASARHGYETVCDRHGDDVLGIVRNSLSVEFLTMVREKYSHQ